MNTDDEETGVVSLEIGSNHDTVRGFFANPNIERRNWANTLYSREGVLFSYSDDCPIAWYTCEPGGKPAGVMVNVAWRTPTTGQHVAMAQRYANESGWQVYPVDVKSDGVCTAEELTVLGQAAMVLAWQNAARVGYPRK